MRGTFENYVTLYNQSVCDNKENFYLALMNTPQICFHICVYRFHAIKTSKLPIAPSTIYTFRSISISAVFYAPLSSYLSTDQIWRWLFNKNKINIFRTLYVCVCGKIKCLICIVHCGREQKIKFSSILPQLTLSTETFWGCEFADEFSTLHVHNMQIEFLNSSSEISNIDRTFENIWRKMFFAFKIISHNAYKEKLGTSCYVNVSFYASLSVKVAVMFVQQKKMLKIL